MVVEESDLWLTNALLPQLRAAEIRSDELYCFQSLAFQSYGNEKHSDAPFGLTLIDAQYPATGVCVSSNRRSVSYPPGIHF